MLTHELSSGYLDSLGIKFVEAKMVDPCGRLRGRTFPVKRFDEIKESFRVDGSSLGYADTEKSDMEIRLLDQANVILPQYQTAIFLGELYDDGTPVPSFGRNILKGVLGKIPYQVKFGAELECYLTTPDLKPLDDGVYMASFPEDTSEEFKKEFMLLTERANSELGIQVEHAEVGPSQHEFEVTFGDPVTVLDRMILLKYLLKFYAAKKGIRATTMPKPYYERAGDGYHMHVSFWDGEESLFYGTEDEVSETAAYAIAGILKHSAENAIFTNNTINSYKRLVPHHEAPIHPVWGYENRTAMIRIPKPNILTKRNTRPEVRNPDFANDPYMSAASIIWAGHLGVDKEHNKIDDFKGNADKLNPEDIESMGLPFFPKKLDEAIELASASGTVPRDIHPDLDRFLKIKRKEAKEYREYLGRERKTPDLIPTQWEINKYFNL